MPADGQRGQDRDRVNEALVEHAENEVDRDQRGQDQDRLIGQRRLEGLGRPLEAPAKRRGEAGLTLGALDRLHGVAQRHAQGQVERQRHGRELPLVAHQQRRRARREAGEGAERHLRAGVGADVDPGERVRALLEVGGDLQHDAVLVALGEDGRDLALTERVVERVVDGLGGHAQTRGGVAVDHDHRLQPAVLLVGGHVAQLGQIAETVQHLRREGVQLVQVRALQRVLVLGVGLAAADPDVLHRLQEQRGARYPAQLAAQAGDDLIDRERPARGAT